MRKTHFSPKNIFWINPGCMHVFMQETLIISVTLGCRIAAQRHGQNSIHLYEDIHTNQGLFLHGGAKGQGVLLLLHWALVLNS